MAYLQLESNNPNLSFLIRKNPASGMIVKQLRSGLLFGYYSNNQQEQFNCFFKDHDSQVSYDPEKSFEYNDVTRYSAASFVNNCFDEFFHDVIAKDQEHDTIGFQNAVLLNCMRCRPKTLSVFENAFRDFQWEYEPLASGLYQIRIRTKQTLRKLLSLASLLALISAIQDREIPFADEKLLIKYAKFIQYLDAPYFARYLFKTSLIRSEKMFGAIREFLETDSIRLTFGHNFLQRMRFVERNIVGNAIIDVGCGEGQYLKLAQKVERYYALDRDEQCLEQCRNRMRKLELTNVELLESLDELPEIPDKKTVLLTEVIEHNTKEDALELVRKCFLPNSRVIITTPNRDFNIHFSSEEEIDETQESELEHETHNLRHSGHLFEFTDAEFQNFISEAITDDTSKVQFFYLGDKVEGITPQSAVIIDIPE